MNVLHTREGGVELRFSVAKVFNNTRKKKQGALILMVELGLVWQRCLIIRTEKKGCITFHLVMFDNSRVAINPMWIPIL